MCVCVFLKGRKDKADHEDQDAEIGAMCCTIIIVVVVVVVVVVIIERENHHHRRRSRKLYNCKLHEKKFGMQTMVIRSIVDNIPGIYQDEKKEE